MKHIEQDARPLIEWYKGELPQSGFHFSTHLKWQLSEPGDSFSPGKAFSKVLGVWWEYDLDSDGRFCLYFNEMRVGTGSYGYPSIAQVLAERCEDAIRKDISAYLKMLDILEISNNLDKAYEEARERTLNN